jgi:hypothetical protein
MKTSAVPFIPNTPDDTHCMQAAYMSIAKHFDPAFNIEMKEWSRLTGYEKELGTWANAALVWFKEHGYEVIHIEEFDYAEFIKRPKEYMVEVNGEQAGMWGYEHTNVLAEVPRMQRMLELDIVEQRLPTLQDIRNFLDQGYLVRVTINSDRLNGRADDYTGHAVVITDCDDARIQLHDPGLPGTPNRVVTISEFEKAWHDQSPELDAIRKLK